MREAAVGGVLSPSTTSYSNSNQVDATCDGNASAGFLLWSTSAPAQGLTNNKETIKVSGITPLILASPEGEAVLYDLGVWIRIKFPLFYALLESYKDALNLSTG